MLKNFDINLFFKLLLLPTIAFFLGYFSNKLFNYNYDYLYHHSLLILFSLLVFVLLNFALRKIFFIKDLQIIILSITSCFIIGIALITTQENLIYTRWLDLGLFPSNDAVDYVDQSAQYIINNDLYSSKGRVIFPILYAGFLAEFKFNIKNIQIITTLLTGVITFYTSLTIYQKYGFISSLIFSCLCSDYLVEHVGGVSTENIGYILGGISFIFFFKLSDDKHNKVINFSLFFLFLFVGYLIRPSIPFLLPLICLWCLIYIKKNSNKQFYKCLFSIFLLATTVLFSNKVLIDTKAPSSPKEFGNIYDSWYATHELGRYYLADKYEEIPGTLWTKIFRDYPHIYELEGKDFVDAKKNVVIKTFKSNFENYAVGSTLQIKNFFNRSKNYVERFDHTAGFLFVEFYHYRSILLILFLIGGVLSIIFFILNRDKINLLIALLFLSILFSQPFILGGESRTSATVLFFINIIILFPFFLLKQSYLSKKLIAENRIVVPIKYSTLHTISIASILLFLFLLFFFIRALINNYSYLKDSEFNTKMECKEEEIFKEIIFNSHSGFYLNSHQKKSKNYYKDFSNILDVYADISSILTSKDSLQYSYTMSAEDILKRDRLKFLNRFNNTNNDRLLGVSKREGMIFNSMVKQYLTDESYYIRPINSTNGKLEEIIVLRVDLIKKGFNKLPICM